MTIQFFAHHKPHRPARDQSPFYAELKRRVLARIKEAGRPRRGGLTVCPYLVRSTGGFSTKLLKVGDPTGRGWHKGEFVSKCIRKFLGPPFFGFPGYPRPPPLGVFLPNRFPRGWKRILISTLQNWGAMAVDRNGHNFANSCNVAHRAKVNIGRRCLHPRHQPLPHRRTGFP